jgi:hypothetical protein
MTIIQASADTRTIHGRDDIIDAYEGACFKKASGEQSKIGIEIEFSLFDKKKNARPLTKEQNSALFEEGTQRGISMRNEPSASCLEIAGNPYTPNLVRKMTQDMSNDIANFHALAAEQEIGISPFGHLPHMPLSEHEIIESERYQTFFSPPREDMKDVYRFFATCLNIQSSVSYCNSDHLLKIIRYAVALEPILFLSTDSSCGFNESKPITHIHNIAGKDKLGINSGIPDFYYTAKTGEELIKNHIDFTLSHPHIFAYFNHDNKLTRLPKGEWVSFNELESRGLGPQNLTNYLQAQSESWRRACNVATITDSETGALTGHRVEIAAFQTGLMHQRATSTLLTFLIAFDEMFHVKLSTLLKEHGIDLSNLASCKDLLENNFKHACYHNNTFHSLPYGTKSLKDFALPFADIIEECASNHNLSALAGPITHILRSGRPDWLVYREKLSTLDDTVGYLAHFDEHLTEAPGLLSAQSCADMILPNLKINARAA